MKSLIRVAVLTLALISAGHASAVFAADAWEIVTPASTSGYSFTSISAMDNYVYLGTNHGVYRSTNSGTTWSQINSGLSNQNVRAMAIGTIFDGSAYAINSDTAVFAATAGGVFKTTIGSTAWSAVNNGLTTTDIKDIQFDQLLATAGTDTTIYVATPAGVFRSDDSGANWLLVDSGMSGQSVIKIMTDFVTGNIYAVTSSNEIYASSMFSFSGVDESWSLAYSGSNIRDISLLNPLGAISWLATDAGILKSDENGINWSSVNSGNTSGRVNVMMSDYLDMNVTYAGSQTGGVYRTLNEALGAPAWAQISTSLSDVAISDIATNPATSLLVYATGANGVYRLELTDAYADVSTTPVVPTDTTNPTITISAPANGATVSGNTVSVTATASDNVGVAGVQFKLDGANLGAEDITAPYSFSWNTASTSNGSHTLTAVARDAAGNTATASTVSVTVNNVVVVPDTTLPTVSTFTVPATATSLTVSGISITATDNIGVTGYIITESSTKPASGVAGWSASAPTSYAFGAAGTKTVYAWAKDAAGNVSNAFAARNVTITLPDTTLPTLTAFTMPTTATSTIVPVSTLTASDNVAVTGYLITESSTKPASGVAGWSATKPTTFTFTGTGARTAYAWAKDAAGNVSNVYTARNITITLADTTSPTITLTSPANGATVSSIVSVSATASDNIGVAGVQFKLDGTNLGAEDTTAPYSFSWNTASTSNGSHTLTAVARDAASNTATASTVSVTVNNVVILDTTAPTAPTNLSVTLVSSNQVNLSWTASTDAVGVIGYRVMRKNGSGPFALIATTAMTTYQNTGLSPLSNYTYVISAYDAVGNVSASSTAVSATTLATPDTTKPTVSLNSPTNNATVSSIVSVSATASDNVGVAGVQFKLDGVNLGSEDTTAPYSFSWNTASTSNGSHTLTAVARDAAGNTQTATVLNVVVSNVVITTPTAPANLSANVISTSQINLAWTVSSEAVSGYEVYRDNNLITTVAHPAASYTDVGLAAGTTYTYSLKSVSATSGVKSAFSNSVSAKTQAKASSGGGGGGGGGSASTRGCTDPKATNYSAKAKKDNGTCKYTVIKSPIAGSSVVVNNPTYTTGYVFTTVMGLGSKGTDVMELQKIMVSLGYLTEAPTGYFGVMTEQAVKKFQISKGLEAVGSVGPQTRIALNQITAKAPAVKSNEQLIKELMALVQELTKKLMLMKAVEVR